MATKKLLDTPLRTVFSWLIIPTLLYFTFWAGYEYAQNNDLFFLKYLKSIWPARSNASPRPDSLTMDYYTVLMGSFSSEEQASQLRSRLASDRIQNELIAQSGRFHVIVGKYTSIKSAQITLSQLQTKGYPGARIIVPAQ